MQPDNQSNYTENNQSEQFTDQVNTSAQAQVNELPKAPPINEAQNEGNSFVPASWPGAWGIYKTSKEVIKSNLGVLLTLIITPYAVDLLMAIAKLQNSVQDITSYVVHSIFAVMLAIAILAAIRGVKLDLSQVFSKITVKLVVGLVLVSIITTIITLFSLLLFIIPAFFIVPRIALAMYFLIDKGLGPVESVKASWEATKGNVGKLYGIFGALLAFGLLMVTIIGIPFAIYFLIMYAAALPLLYTYATSKTTQVGDTETVTSPQNTSVNPISAN